MLRVFLFIIYVSWSLEPSTSLLPYGDITFSNYFQNMRPLGLPKGSLACSAHWTMLEPVCWRESRCLPSVYDIKFSEAGEIAAFYVRKLTTISILLKHYAYVVQANTLQYAKNTKHF